MCRYFIGNPEDFVPSGCYFRLVGEREDVWRRMARPADYVAKRCLHRDYGRYVAEVMRRPQWTFEKYPESIDFDPDGRLVDGLLCGSIINEAMHPRRSNTEPQELKFIVLTVDDYFEATYLRPVQDKCAYFVDQIIWQPPEGWQRDEMAYKKNCPWRHVHIKDDNAVEDDQYMQRF